MRSSNTTRAGVTLVEVLIVLSLFCGIAGILVKGLLATRERAARIQCLNNMRQIALAIQNYDQQYRVLPPGTVNPPGPIVNRPIGLHIGWIIQILPYMEQAGLATSINTEYSVYGETNAGVRATRLSTLACPSDRNAGVFQGLAVSSYAGCHHDLETPIDADNHGVFFLNSRVSYEDITDGSSNTIYFGEKRVDRPDLGWLSGTSATLRNTGEPINGKGPGAPTPSAPNRSEVSPVGGFSSHHPGGAHFSFGDGSVRFVSETINTETYRHLGHRADGDLVGAGQF